MMREEQPAPTPDEEIDSPLAKVHRVKVLFAIPLCAWGLLLLANLFVQQVDAPFATSVARTIATIAFYSVPVVFLWLVIATVFSSWGILDANDWRNPAAFAAVQLIAMIVTNFGRWRAPELHGAAALAAIGLITAVVVAAMWLINLLVMIPAPGTAAARPGVGTAMAVIFSALLASFVFFQPKEGDPFLPYGVMLGVAIGVARFGGDKMTLSFLYFLIPRSAVTLFRLVKLEGEVEEQEQLHAEQRVEAKLMRKRDAIQWSGLVLEAQEKVRKAMQAQARADIADFMQSVDEREHEPRGAKISWLRDGLQQLEQYGPDHPLLPGMIASGDMSIGERLHARAGLEGDQLRAAAGENLIATSQQHLWTPQVQHRVRVGLHDAKQGNVVSMHGIAVPRSLTSFFEKNAYLLERLTKILANGTSAPALVPITGDPDHLQELRFQTLVSDHSGIIKRGNDGMWVILAVVDVPSPPSSGTATPL